MGLVITGMHRSGTSATARVVEGLGVTMGPDALRMGPSPDNPRGFFERVDVMEVNDRWLKTLGGAWWAPPTTSPSTWAHLDGKALSNDRARLGLFDPTEDNWFVKDPRISLLLPLWDRLALTTLPAVLVVRDPRECVMSVHLRDGLTPRRALALWFAYVRSSLQQTSDRDVLLVSYDALVEVPHQAIEAMVEFLSQTCGHRDHLKSLEDLVALVEPALRRNRRRAVPGVPNSDIDAALDVFRLLAKLHGESNAELPSAIEVPDWVDDVLDELRESLLLQTRIEEATGLATHLETSLQSLHAPDGELAQTRKRAARHESLARAAADKVEALSHELQLLRGDLDADRKSQAVIQSELGRVRQLLAEAESRLAEEGARASEAAGDFEDEIRARDTTISALRDQLDALAIRRKELEASLEERERARDELLLIMDEQEDRLRQASTEVSSLNERHDQLKDVALSLHGQVVAHEGEAAQSQARIASLEAELVERTVLAEGFHSRLVEAMLRIDELTDLRHRLAQDVAEARTLAMRRDEALAALTSSLEKARAEAWAAAKAASRTKGIEAAVRVEGARRERLAEALARAIDEGQQLAAELDATRSSRSYRYGRRLTAPARFFRAGAVTVNPTTSELEGGDGRLESSS